MVDATSPLSLQIRSLLKRPLITCLMTDTIATASRAMTAQGGTSIIVLDPDGQPRGIITDRDLRERVLAVGRSPAEPVMAIMTTPLVSVSPEAFVLEAVVEMARHGIHHLLVVEGGRLLGLVTSDDLLRVEATQPLELVRAIQASTSFDDLATRVPDLTAVVRQLVDQGLSGYEIGRIVSEVNDQLIRRTLGFAEEGLRDEGFAAPPVAFCWLALGSEGRREQTLRTDQDNGLVYEDPPAGMGNAAQRYFLAFAERAIEGLVRLGYPRCRGGSMASNPRWCQPLSVWRGYFEDWARDTTPEHLMYASIYLDFRPVAGEARLARDLRDEVRARVTTWRSFPRYLAKIAVSHAPPLGLFGRFKCQRSNGRRGVNVKLGGMLLLNNALRAYAIELGLDETNTIERLEAAARVGRCFTEGETDEIRAAYETIFRLRLRHQLAQLDAGQEPDNFLDPYALGRADQRRLRDAFRAIHHLQGKVEDRYFTQILN
ncbi:MAG TPA: DUF294 nucleotidyltransferase-like domain-containing protein [Methylomirabilota bacterium]|nr:DUF294 nucleotidyltransferase-like domain-containing protein [Methylomirabilota bacterium]